MEVLPSRYVCLIDDSLLFAKSWFANERGFVYSALSLALPFMTLVAHATASLVVHISYDGTWTSLFSAWCAIAAAASVMGFVGAVQVGTLPLCTALDLEPDPLTWKT